jgi:hypothetical protein
MRLLYGRADDYVTGDRFEIWECRHCRAARTLPVPSDLGKYYPERYRHYRPLVAAILTWLYRRRARRWARLLGPPGSVFEMDCGNGMMLDTLRRWGWRSKEFSMSRRRRSLWLGPERAQPAR